MTRYSAKTGLPLAYQVGPFDIKHVFVQWSGALPGGEHFSCGVRMAPKTTGISAVTTAMVDAIVAGVIQFHTSVNTQISPRCKLNSVKVNRIAETGLYLDGTTIERILSDTPGTGVVNQTPANQVACAVSLTTGVNRGPAHAGRFFMPLPCYTVESTGMISTVDAAACSLQTDELISDFNAAHADFEVAIFSRKAGAPAHRAVTGNQVGRVLDTQRRRRRSLVENYQ